MKLQDKIIYLRKTNGMSQEKLAEELNVSRQAISRWELGTVVPDSKNILEMIFVYGHYSKLYLPVRIVMIITALIYIFAINPQYMNRQLTRRGDKS